MPNAQYAIPDKLVAVLKGEQKFPQDYTGQVFRVRPAFVVDANTNLVETARKWGRGETRYHNENLTFEEVVLDNTPLTRLTVLSLEKRREGGVAIKVMTEQGWLVDLREEEFFEAVITGAVEDSVIIGEYVWSRGITQMRLVRVGSHLYNERIKFGNGVKP